jgi:hypothetical protein
MTSPYEAAAREAADKPVTFRLHGEKFATKVEVDGMVIMDLAKAGVEEDDMSDSEAAGLYVLASFQEFLSAVLAPGDWRRFRKVCRRHNVGLEQIITIAKDIMPLLFGFPTAPSVDSAASPSAIGRTSTDGVTTLAPVASTG